MDQKPSDDAAPPVVPPQNADTVLLKDLAPRQDVKGGSGKLRFGETKPAETHDQS